MNIEDLSHFDPNESASKDSGIFGLPFIEINSALVVLPVPWDATTSYRQGACEGPAAVLKASHQIDLFDSEVLRPYSAGIFMRPLSDDIRRKNKTTRELVQKARQSSQFDPMPVNDAGSWLNHFVYDECSSILASEKMVGVLGGDHSAPFGAIRAIGEKYENFGILHLDAHSDMRKGYEGFTWSHASIMYNVLENIPSVSRLVQVGIRDFCEEEFDYGRKHGSRVSTFLDKDLNHRKFQGTPWVKTCEDIISHLPGNVWVSFDIDALEPHYCPNTGTPVPGGLSFSEAVYLISSLVRSGRKIVGFDLCEVAPDLSSQSEWDANVGARLLYKLSGFTLASWDRVSLLKTT